VSHELGSERALGGELVVRPAAEPDVGHRGLAAPGDLECMIELEPLALLAPTALLAHERALRSVPLPDGTTYVRRDIARVLTGRPAGTGPAGRGEFLFLDFADSCIQGVFEDLAEVP